MTECLGALTKETSDLSNTVNPNGYHLTHDKSNKPCVPRDEAPGSDAPDPDHNDETDRSCENNIGEHSNVTKDNEGPEISERLSCSQFSNEGHIKSCDKCTLCLDKALRLRNTKSDDGGDNLVKEKQCQPAQFAGTTGDIILMEKCQCLSLTWRATGIPEFVPHGDTVDYSDNKNKNQNRSDTEQCDELKLREDRSSFQIIDDEKGDDGEGEKENVDNAVDTEEEEGEEEEKWEKEEQKEKGNVGSVEKSVEKDARDIKLSNDILVCSAKECTNNTQNASSEDLNKRSENHGSQKSKGKQVQIKGRGTGSEEQSQCSPLENSSEGQSDTEISMSNTETVEAHVQISNQDIRGEESDASSDDEITDEELIEEFPDGEEWHLQLDEDLAKPEPLYEVGPLCQNTCEICLEDGLLNLRPCCKTPVCDSCMATYLETMISSGKVQIRCPGICQQKYLPRLEIVGRVSVEMKEKYHKFLTDANNEPNVKTCPRCSHIMNIDLVQLRNPKVKEKGLQVICTQCDLYWCFPCQAPWHYGITCKDHRKGDKLLKKWAKEESDRQVNAQRCPKCKIFIQRISGCEHMTCSKCGTSFCYRCGERYCRLKFFGDHFSRYSIFGCKYIYKADQPLQRRLIRGSIFGTRLLVAPVVGALAVTGGVLLLSSALLFYLPCYGVKKLRKRRKDAKAMRQLIEERRRFEAKILDIRNMGDPYIAQYNRFRELGVNPYRTYPHPLPIQQGNELDTAAATSL